MEAVAMNTPSKVQSLVSYATTDHLLVSAVIALAICAAIYWVVNRRRRAESNG